MKHSLRNILLLLLMLCSAAMAVVLKPTRFIAEPSVRMGYEQIIPKQFGDWKAEDDKGSLVVNPQQEAQLKNLYSEVLSRTYVHSQTGRKVMLSIAYSADQTHENQVHKPEVCYPAQGFELLGTQKDWVQTNFGKIPAMRVLARHGQRVEPVTYWIRIGDKVVRGAIEQNLARVQFGLLGRIPDGLLFRVSSIEENAVAAHRLQDQFVDDLLRVLSPEDRAQFVGQVLPTNAPRVNSLSDAKVLKD